MPPKDHDCVQVGRIDGMEDITRKAVTWEQGIAVVGGAFGICCLGFILLHGMITAEKTFASEQLTLSVAEQSNRVNRLEDHFNSFMIENDKQHREIMALLLRMQK